MCVYVRFIDLFQCQMLPGVLLIGPDFLEQIEPVGVDVPFVAQAADYLFGLLSIAGFLWGRSAMVRASNISAMAMILAVTARLLGMMIV